MSRHGLTAALLTSLTIAIAVAASAQTATPPAGTAVIRGRVLDGDSGRPLRRALVRALITGGTGDRVVLFEGRRENRTATTDEQGRYELTDLPAGRYTVTASKGTYVGLSIGQTRPGDSPKPLDIADRQVVDKVDFSLLRGGVITGHVVDEYGDPVPNVQVAAMRSQFRRGQRQLVGGGGSTVVTDDLGEYRLFGLSPADYYVAATYRVPPASETDDDVPGYAVTYAPGTVNTTAAQRIALGSTRSMDEVNIALVPVKISQVSGTAVNSQGQPMSSAFVSAMDRNNPFGSASGAQIKPDGTFVIRNVAPGEYLLRAQNQPRQGGRSEMATTTISVAGQDVEGVQLVVIPPSTASGVVLVDPAAAAATKASSIFLMVSPIDPQMNFMDTSGRLKDDFTFEAAVQPGANMVRLLSMPPSLALKAVRVGGVDVTDTGFDVKPNVDVRGIEIELTSHPTVVSGQVTDAHGASSKDCMVVIFARDDAKWEGTSRYIQTARPDQDGRFKVSGLPPGDYHVVATSTVQQPDQAGDPDVLKQLRDRAAALSLGEGETKVVDLKVSTGS